MGNHLKINMKFFALLLAFVCVVTSVEANSYGRLPRNGNRYSPLTFETSERKSCWHLKRRFKKWWYKIDRRRRDSWMSYKEYTDFLLKYAKKHHKNRRWISKYRRIAYKRFHRLLPGGNVYKLNLYR